tara:strand:+ start:386 stop:592 length:207 start_codon:yes stop_codon:yes gene_type:complete
MLNKKQLSLVLLGLRDLKAKKLWNKDLNIFDLLKAGLSVDAEAQVTKAQARWEAVKKREQARLHARTK